MEIKIEIKKASYTHGVASLLGEQVNYLVNEFIYLHSLGNWGDISESDKKSNDESLLEKGMVLSKFYFNGHSIFVITDCGHETTTVLLPSEY
ncbi:hypothetical protein ACWU37_21935 (plasmid) [Photobacterium damselae subsp. damselae]